VKKNREKSKKGTKKNTGTTCWGWRRRNLPEKKKGKLRGLRGAMKQMGRASATLEKTKAATKGRAFIN